MNTDELIQKLGKGARAVKPLPAPRYFAVGISLILALYAFGMQCFSGLRPDLAVQLTRFAFSLEIFLLAALCFSSVTAATLSAYPDAYQKKKLLYLPYVIFVALTVLTGIQFFIPPTAGAVLCASEHGPECALSIAAITILPSVLIFILLRKGATVKPGQSGAFAVLAASAIGCLTIRLAEQDDSITHVALWHYLPTLCFAIIGAFLGERLVNRLK